MGPNKTNEEEKENTIEEAEKKANIFQRVFESIIQIIRELWFERNTDCHRSLQGQQRIEKITEATRTVTNLYSL